ncbi:MAG: STAS domain-containing protein [Armatimonadetes bacterium]|nr:STAS domain-containing protein [Armatimonadota bacterium]
MEFNLSSRAPEENLTVIDLRGEVDAFTAPKLKQEIINLIERGTTKLAVNLADVKYLDSTGLGVLIGGLKRTRDRGGELVLICPNVRIMRIFEITGLSRIFEMFQSEAEALDHLKGK